METIAIKDVSQMSAKELQEVLKKKMQEEKADHEKKRKQYEADRNLLVAQMIGQAKELQQLMIGTKKSFMEAIETFQKKAMEYSDINSNSKGGFSLRSSDGSQKVVYERNVKNEYDERAKQAEELIKDFLSDTVKKKDKAIYELITGLMSKNNKGEYSTPLIAKLLKHENEFNDDRWIKAMQFFKESYNEVLISYSVSFYEKTEQGKDEHINLTFASL